MMKIKKRNSIEIYKDKNIIKVKRNHINTYNSPIITMRGNNLLSYNNSNMQENKEKKDYIYKKTKVKYLHKSQNKCLNQNIHNIIKFENNINNDNYLLFLISPKRNIKTINNSTYRVPKCVTLKKEVKIKKKVIPRCHLYYYQNNEKKKKYNQNTYNTFSCTNKRKSNSCNYVNINNSNYQTIYNNQKNSSNKTKVISGSESTALSIDESNINNYYSNKEKKAMYNTIYNNHGCNFSIDYSLNRNNIIYKKAIITPFDCFSFDDINLKKKENSINSSIDLTKKDFIPLVTFGNNIFENKTISVNTSKSNNDINNNLNNNNNDQYISKLKKENDLLKSALIQTNEKINLLENKIENLLEEKIKYVQINNNENSNENKNIELNKKCPFPALFDRKFSKNDFFEKKNTVKYKINTKEKIKPVIDRILRCDKNKKENKIHKSNNENLKNNKNHNKIKENKYSTTTFRIKKNNNKKISKNHSPI